MFSAMSRKAATHMYKHRCMHTYIYTHIHKYALLSKAVLRHAKQLLQQGQAAPLPIVPAPICVRMCIYVCMYVYMYIYIYIHTHKCVCAGEAKLLPCQLCYAPICMYVCGQGQVALLSIAPAQIWHIHTHTHTYIYPLTITSCG
jgi:hypothetical protein